jgi:hypothetical protein
MLRIADDMQTHLAASNEARHRSDEDERSARDVEATNDAAPTMQRSKCCMQVAARNENRNFHERALLSLVKRWYKPI